VLINLLSNGIYFNHSGGEVTVSAKAVPGAVEILVKDTGVGIDAEEIPFVWERFYRSSVLPQEMEAKTGKDNNTTSQSKGSGIGLSIVRSIIRAHGGRTWVESIPGKGSIFGFSIPVD